MFQATLVITECMSLPGPAEWNAGVAPTSYSWQNTVQRGSFSRQDAGEVCSDMHPSCSKPLP